jgi:hypothetical protein
MVVISYLLFIFTLIILLEHEKPGGENNKNKIKKKSSQYKNIHEKKNLSILEANKVENSHDKNWIVL